MSSLQESFTDRLIGNFLGLTDGSIDIEIQIV